MLEGCNPNLSCQPPSQAMHRRRFKGGLGEHRPPLLKNKKNLEERLKKAIVLLNQVLLAHQHAFLDIF